MRGQTIQDYWSFSICAFPAGFQGGNQEFLYLLPNIQLHLVLLAAEGDQSAGKGVAQKINYISCVAKTCAERDHLLFKAFVTAQQPWEFESKAGLPASFSSEDQLTALLRRFSIATTPSCSCDFHSWSSSAESQGFDYLSMQSDSNHASCLLCCCEPEDIDCGYPSAAQSILREAWINSCSWIDRRACCFGWVETSCCAGGGVGAHSKILIN